MPPDLRSLPGRATAAVVVWSVRRAAFVILGAALLTAALLHYTATHIAINTDTEDMLDPSLPHRQAHREFRAAFPDLPRDIVLYTEGSQAGAVEAAADALAAQLRTRPDIARIVERPGGDPFFATQGLLYLDVEALWALDERLQAAAPMLGTLAADPSLRGLAGMLGRGLEAAADDASRTLLAGMFERVADALERLARGENSPIGWRDEMFEAGTAAGPARAFVLLRAAQAPGHFQPTAPAVEALRALLPSLMAAHPGVRVRMTGSAVMDNEELVTVAHDAVLTTALSFICVAGVLVMGLRSASLVAAILVTLACGLVWTAAFATFAVGALNLISVSFAVLFIGMGVDFGIQYSMRYLEETGTGHAREPALHDAARGAGGALLLAAVGAAISFFAFVPTAYLGLAQLGLISGFSMFVAWFANITLLPALYRCLPVPARRTASAATLRGPDFIARHYRGVLWLALGVSIVCVCVLPRAHFDPNPLNLKDGDTEGVAAFRALAEDPISSPYRIQILAPSLADADALAARIATLPEVARAVTLSSYVPAAQDDKLGVIEGLALSLTGVLDPADQPPAATTVEELASLRALLARLVDPLAGEDAGFARARQRLAAALQQALARRTPPDAWVPALRAQLIGDLPDTLARLARLLEATPVNLAMLPAALHAAYVSADGRARVEVFPAQDLNARDAMGRFVRAVQTIAPRATDAPVELYEGSRAVIDACMKASLWALALTLVLHLGVLRGVLDALLVAAPLVLGILMTVATSVLADMPFNFANIIALPLLIGLNNAYGAYLVVRAQDTTQVGALLHSSTPRAILFSGMTTLTSFGALGLSKHPGMAGMGVLIAVSLVYAIVSALGVLPALLAAQESGRRH